MLQRRTIRSKLIHYKIYFKTQNHSHVKRKVQAPQQRTMAATTTSPKAAQPSLPPFYLREKEGKEKKSDSSLFEMLPSELSMQCLVEYSTWGDLAKLATVQSSFKDLLRDAADFGGSSSKWELTQALLDGNHGLERNPKLAVEYLRELATGDADSDIDSMCDETPAAKEKLFPPAMRKLASCYLQGDGVEKDIDRGLRWLKYAATSGCDVDAAHEIALIHEYSLHGVETDVVRAADWFLKAAENGHVEAMAEYAM